MSVVPESLVESAPILRCPACGYQLEVSNVLRCGGCAREFHSTEGIPRLFWPDNAADASVQEVTEAVKAFYEEIPFPNYEDFDSRATLEAKARQAVFADVVDRGITDDAMVLEAGCGTGQLSNFLALRGGRRVFATDICLNSLRLGHDFATRNDIKNVAFVQMNLFRPAFAPGTFDLVVSNGVLHHTADPFRGFRSITGLVRQGGLVIVGLYNRFGRIMTNVRRGIFEVGGTRLAFLDPRLRAGGIGEKKRHTWYMDQYRHPHESQHTLGEVMAWFDQCGVEFVNSIPRLSARKSLSGVERSLLPHPKGGIATRALVQAQMALADREGGFFVVIGRRR